MGDGQMSKSVSQLVLWIALIWAGLIAVGSITGFFSDWFSFVPPVIALLFFALIFVYFKRGVFQKWVIAFGLRNLTAIQIWRVLAAGVFFWYGSQGLLPEAFVFWAGWGDLIAGILALIAIALPFRLSAYWTCHIFGLLDFFMAVGIGVTLNQFDVPSMENIALFPLALIPLFGVPLSGASHLMAIHMMGKKVGFNP